MQPFPLLAEPQQYEPETFNIVDDPGARSYWLGVLRDSIPGVVDKAALSEQRTPGQLRAPGSGVRACCESAAPRRAASAGASCDMELRSRDSTCLLPGVCPCTGYLIGLPLPLWCCRCHAAQRGLWQCL